MGITSKILMFSENTWILAVQWRGLSSHRSTYPCSQGTGSICLPETQISTLCALDSPDFCRAPSVPTTGNRISSCPRRRPGHLTAKPAPLRWGVIMVLRGYAPRAPGLKQGTESALQLRLLLFTRSGNGSGRFVGLLFSSSADGGL